MRIAFALISVLLAGCASRPPPDTTNYQAAFQKDLEDQLGITRARQRAEACTRLARPAIGMSASQVTASCWGQPDNAAESITAQGKTAVWGYPEGHVYLVNGVVVRIVTIR